MIKSLFLKNYRSHKDTFIEFSKGVNCLTGQNDAGKTNLIRGITTIIKNRPAGDDFVSHWGGNMEVGIAVDNKIVIRYKDVIKDKKNGGFKSGAKNYYILINADNIKGQVQKDYKKAIKTGKDSGCVEVFKSFGQGIPEKIKPVLNMGDINLSPQFAKPFLLDDSAPDVAKFYNKIVNLDIIDSTVSNISKMLKSEKKNLNIEESKHEEKQKELKTFDWIEDTEAKIKRYEKIQREIKGIKNSWNDLFQLNKSLITLNEESDKVNKIVQHEKKTTRLIELINVIKKDNSLFIELKSLYNEYNSCVKQKEKANKIIVFWSEVESLISLSESIDTIKIDYSLLKSLINKLSFLKSTKNKLNNILKYGPEVGFLIDSKNEIQELNDNYNSLAALADQLDDINSNSYKYTDIIKHESSVDALISLNADIGEQTDIYNELFDLNEGLIGYDNSLARWKRKQEEYEQELSDNWPSECPLCGK